VSRKLKFFQTCSVTHLYRTLGRNIAHFRLKANLTQEELAEKTDYSVDFIGLVERGVNAPTVARLKDIADVIGVEIWQLFHPRTGQAFDGGSRPSKPRKPARRTSPNRSAARHRKSAA
jgi:transcriptional regulator with XRE-family HTH domain